MVKTQRETITCYEFIDLLDKLKYRKTEKDMIL